MSTAAPASIAFAPRPVFGTRPALLALLLAILTVAAFYPVRHLPFINYDDNQYVTDNPNVQAGVDRELIRWAFTTYDTANWHPLTWLSHALDCQWFGVDPAGPHLVNLLLHTVNVLLLFWVLSQATGFGGRSFVVAALFAVHPLNVESVAWVAERKNLLSMLFFLLALGAYRGYARRPRVWSYSVVATLLALGLMAKPQIITLPFILLLWDYWPLARNSGSGRPLRRWAWLVTEKLPLFAMAAGSAVVTILAHARGAMRPLPLSLRLANAIVCYLRYITLAIWPARLAVYYPHPLLPLRSLPVLIALLFLLAVSVFVFVGQNRRCLVVGWSWFLITLLPMIGVVQVGTQAMADRYAYLPLIGIFLMAVWIAADWGSQRHMPVVAQSAAVLLIVAALIAVTHRQLQYWRDSVTLWSHTLQVTHDNAIAEVDLGAALVQAGRLEEAMQHFRAALQIDPLDPLSNMYLARYAQMQNNLPEAIAAYRKVIQVTHDPALKARAYNYMGDAYRALGDEAEAERCFLAAGGEAR